MSEPGKEESLNNQIQQGNMDNNKTNLDQKENIFNSNSSLHRTDSSLSTGSTTENAASLFGGPSYDNSDTLLEQNSVVDSPLHENADNLNSHNAEQSILTNNEPHLNLESNSINTINENIINQNSYSPAQQTYYQSNDDQIQQPNVSPSHYYQQSQIYPADQNAIYQQQLNTNSYNQPQNIVPTSNAIQNQYNGGALIPSPPTSNDVYISPGVNQQSNQFEENQQHIKQSQSTIAPPPKGPSPSVYSPIIPSMRRSRASEPGRSPPRKVFVPGQSTNSTEKEQQNQGSQSPSQNRKTQRSQSQVVKASSDMIKNMVQASPPPNAPAVRPQIIQSSSTPSTRMSGRRSPIVIAPFIPGKSTVQTATTRLQPANPQENQPQVQQIESSMAFQAPPPITISPNSKKSQPNVTNTQNVKPVSQSGHKVETSQPRPSGVFIPGQPATLKQNSSNNQYQQSAINLSGVYIPGQANKAENESPTASTNKPPTAFYQPNSSKQTITTQIAQPPQSIHQQAQFTQPPPTPFYQPNISNEANKNPQFAQPPSNAFYQPNIANEITQQPKIGKAQYVPGMSNMNTSAPKIQIPPPTPQMQMPIPIPVGVPIAHEADDSSETKRIKKRRKIKKSLKSKKFEPSSIPRFQSPESVAERGNALPYSQTTENVSLLNETDSEYEYEYEEYDSDEHKLKRSVSEPESVVPISQFTGAFEPFFVNNKKPVFAFGFGGLIIQPIKEGQANNSVIIKNINDSYKEIEQYPIGDNNDLFKDFILNQIAETKDIQQKLLWASAKVFLEYSLKPIETTNREILISSTVNEFRKNINIEGTSENELLKILNSSTQESNNQNDSSIGESNDQIDSPERKEDSFESVKNELPNQELEINENKNIQSKESELFESVQRIIAETGEEAALEFCIKNNMWPLALIISSSLSNESSKQVISQYINSNLNNFAELKNVLNTISGSFTFDKNEWTNQLKGILIHLTSRSIQTTLIDMIKSLSQNNLNTASLACRLLALLPLSRLMHLNQIKNEDEFDFNFHSNDLNRFISLLQSKNPNSATIIQLTGILGNQNEVNWKILYSLLLADFGLIRKAKDFIKRNNLMNIKNCLINKLQKDLQHLSTISYETEIMVFPLREEDLPPPKRDDDNFFIPMYPFQQHEFDQPVLNQTQQEIPMKHQPVFAPVMNPIKNNMDNNENLFDDQFDPQNYDNSQSDLTAKSEKAAPKPKENVNSMPKVQQLPEGETKPGWFSGLFSKLNPFAKHSTVVDLSQHDNGDMIWNGHKYVQVGHEDEQIDNFPPPPPKGNAPTVQASPNSPPPPTPMGFQPPPSGKPMTTQVVARTRASNRYVTNF